jgi:hypothetical protein
MLAYEKGIKIACSVGAQTPQTRVDDPTGAGSRLSVSVQLQLSSGGGGGGGGGGDAKKIRRSV